MQSCRTGVKNGTGTPVFQDDTGAFPYQPSKTAGMQDSLHSPFHHSVESLALSLDLSLSNSNYCLFSVWNSKSESSMESFVIVAQYLWNCVCSLISISRDSSRYERGTQRHDARSCDPVSIPPSLVESGDVGLGVTQWLWINNQYLIMAPLQFFPSYSVWTETPWPWHPSWESTRWTRHGRSQHIQEAANLWPPFKF